MRLYFGRDLTHFAGVASCADFANFDQPQTGGCINKTGVDAFAGDVDNLGPCRRREILAYL